MSAAGQAGAPPALRVQPHSAVLMARRLLHWDGTGVLLATVALIIVTGLLRPAFLNKSQLLEVAQSAVYVGLLAGGMAFLLAMRELDVSVGSTFALTLVFAALLMKHGVNPWLAAAAGIVGGGVLGLNNALIVQVVSVPTIVATLATLSLYRGLALAISSGQQVTGMPLDSSFFTVLGNRLYGVPAAVWLLLLVMIALAVLMHHTAFGYRVRSIGSNPEAAAFTGISIGGTRLRVLVLMGALAGLAGMLGLSFFTSGDPTIGTGFELQAVAAAIIGGTPLRGGRATIPGAVIGGFLLSVVTSALAYFDIPVNYTTFAIGAVILVAVSVDGLLRRRRGRAAT